MCDDAPVEINCWHEVGRKGAKKDVVRLRKLPVAEVKQLHRTLSREMKDEVAWMREWDRLRPAA